MKLLALISLLSSLALLANAYLLFDPARLALTSDLRGGLVHVRLAARPPRTVAVYFDAPKTRFDRCSLVFTPDNWATPQALRVVSEPYATLAPAERQEAIKFQAYSEDCNWINNNKTVTLPTSRDPGSAGQCTIWGDPHFTMFDLKTQYHFQGSGDYYYVQSDILTVQARHVPCWGTPTCIIGVGIRYGSNVFFLDATKRDVSQIIQAVTKTKAVTFANKGNTYEFNFNSGSNIKITVVPGGTTYSNVEINLGTYMRGRTAGLCGTFDGNNANDFTGSNGKVYDSNVLIGESNRDPGNGGRWQHNKNLKAFGDSWLVPDSDNIFKGSSQTNKLPLDVLISQCLRPDPSSVKCSWADPEACLESWQPSWTFVQQGTRLRRSELPSALKNTTCDPTSVVPKPLAVAPISQGFKVLDTIAKFAGEGPTAPVKSTNITPENLTPAQKREVDYFVSRCSKKIHQIPLCTRGYENAIKGCQEDIKLLVHPDGVYPSYREQYQSGCEAELQSLCVDGNKEACEEYKKQSFGNQECDTNCKMCSKTGCDVCKDETLFEVGPSNTCVPRDADELKPSRETFGRPPAKMLWSEDDIAPPTNGNPANLFTNFDAAFNQELGSGPIRLA